MTAREIFDEMSDKDLSKVFNILCYVFDNFGHFPDFSDYEFADLSIKLFGDD